MTKDTFIRLLLCENWFSLKSWKGKNWKEKEKQIWISGMHKAWNILNPDNQIEPLEIYRLREQWTKEQAEQWYSDYLKPQEDEHIESRWEILDI